jgi:predicted lipid-binding transport protein (Tim44 family)
MLKIWSMLALLVGLGLVVAPSVSEAKRLGGGKSVGMQRATPDKPAQSTPATPAATPNNAAATPANAAAPNPAAAAPKRSWMGPLAGLAAGLGLAALFSHFGMGEGLANFVMLALLAVVAIVAVRWLLRRFAGGGAPSMPFAMAGGAAAGGSSGTGAGATRSLPMPGTAALAPSADAVVAGPALPADFDTAAFERIAKMIFIRLQAAHDSGDLNDLRAFTTPEMFAEVRLELQERGASTQKTDVVTVDARLIDFAQEADRQVVSVRFSGLMREDVGAEAAPFDEVWHLVKPLDDSRNWAIAGIQQRQ